MQTIRITAVLLTFIFCISNASAQLVHSVVTAHPHINQDSRNGRFQTLSLPFTVSESDSNRVQLNNDGTFTFECTVTNLSQGTDTIYFKRSQILPIGWSSSVCWGSTCYAPDDSFEHYDIPQFGFASLSLNVSPCLNNVPDSTTIWLEVGVLGSSSDTVMLPFHISFIPPNPPLVFQWSGLSGVGPSFDTTFEGAGEHSIRNLLENEFGLGANYNFTIQDSLPQGWSLTTCVQSNYADTCTSGNNLTVNFSDINDSTDQQAVKFTLNVPALTATDSAIIYFGVHPEISSPADSATYRFSIVVQNTNGVTSQPSEQAGMTITNAWPNPLHPASTLHLNVMADQAGSVTAGVYDLNGILRGTLEFGSLNAGSNDLQASMPDLPSGEYIIRLQQGIISPQIVRVNYIK